MKETTVTTKKVEKESTAGNQEMSTKAILRMIFGMVTEKCIGMMEKFIRVQKLIHYYHAISQMNYSFRKGHWLNGVQIDEVNDERDEDFDEQIDGQFAIQNSYPLEDMNGYGERYSTQ